MQLTVPTRLLRALILPVALAWSSASAQRPVPARPQWTPERARAWYDSTGWVAGANYVPSSAGNQLEMWQAATWDPATIEREMAYAESLGMNTMRVFLHDLLWRQDAPGFLKRIDAFLTITSRHHIRPVFVLFDAVWDPFPHTGKQRAPYPHLHNSIWVQSPGLPILLDPTRHQALRAYVFGVVHRFAGDRRVLAWDIFNEPDNTNYPAYFVYEPRDKGAIVLPLLRKAFQWAREAGATQPLTAAPWKGDYADASHMLPITKVMLDESDVISFHSYDPLPRTQALVTALERYHRPIIASEYMARPVGSTFATHLPYFAEHGVGAINWGFVNGRSQTIYPWDSWRTEYTAAPTIWFHDVVRADGTPYDSTETALIRSTTRAHTKVAPR